MRKVAVVICRAQPFHNGHLNLIKKAADITQHVIVLVGSADNAPSAKNPLSFAERKELILRETSSVFFTEIEVKPLYDDLYENNFWYQQVRDSIPDGSEVYLVGSMKPDTWYLGKFPEWKYVNVDQSEISPGIRCATDIRNHIYGSIDPYVGEFEKYKAYSQQFEYGRQCHLYNKKYKNQFAPMPFKPNHVTTDAFVYCLGHILLVKRRSMPGKGLWALPGGFLNTNETTSEGIVRELEEETGLVLDADTSLMTKVFDHPDRSERGRILTHCGLFILKDATKLPWVKGSDDAEKAKWVVPNKIGLCFEDHKSMIKYMHRRVGAFL